jgi:hypothetical protein
VGLRTLLISDDSKASSEGEITDFWQVSVCGSCVGQSAMLVSNLDLLPCKSRLNYWETHSQTASGVALGSQSSSYDSLEKDRSRCLGKVIQTQLPVCRNFLTINRHLTICGYSIR